MPLKEHLRKMGYNLNEEELNKLTVRFKELADVKKEIFDEDLEAILFDEVFRVEDKYKLVYLNVVSGNVAIPTATMQMEIDKESAPGRRVRGRPGGCGIRGDPEDHRDRITTS